MRRPHDELGLYGLDVHAVVLDDAVVLALRRTVGVDDDRHCRMIGCIDGRRRTPCCAVWRTRCTRDRPRADSPGDAGTARMPAVDPPACIAAGMAASTFPA